MPQPTGWYLHADTSEHRHDIHTHTHTSGRCENGNATTVPLMGAPHVHTHTHTRLLSFRPRCVGAECRRRSEGTYRDESRLPPPQETHSRIIRYGGCAQSCRLQRALQLRVLVRSTMRSCLCRAHKSAGLPPHLSFRPFLTPLAEM